MLSCLALAASSLLCVPPRSTTPPTPAATYIGRENQLQVRIPRVEGEAAVADDRRRAQRARVVAGRVADRLLAVLAARRHSRRGLDAGADLVFADGDVRRHSRVRGARRVHATLADRDKITADDNVQVLLGTFHDRRQAYVFAVNPFGVQMDGTIVEAGAATGGWTPTLSGRTAPDLSQDFVFTSKGRLTEYGYEVEIRIPFKSLKYQSADEQSWDINVVRQVQHSGYEDSWAPAQAVERVVPRARRARSTDLRGFDRGLVLDLNPVVTRKATGAPSPDGWGYTHPRPQLGGNVRWGMTNNLTLNGTVNPDFAEVESDAGQFVIDPRQSLFFPEKRPFFLEGLEQFNVPHNLIYTRRIAKPDGAIKLTGKVAGTSIGFLSASDDQVALGERPVRHVLQHSARAARRRRTRRASAWRTPIAWLAATTIASPTSTAASCSATCTSGSFQYARELRQDARRR